jgi:hypothetical protein
VGCIEDAAAAVIGPVVSSISGASPRWLACRTLGDQMKARDPRSKVVACSLKARSAVLMGGHRADGAFWWEHNAQSGAFVTSTYYGTSLPPWLAELNESGTCQNWTTALWTRLLDAETYQARCGSDDAAYEMGAVLGVGNGFPHPYVGGSDPYAALMTSPAGNELVLQVAGKLLDAYALGQRGGASDLLCISLSSNDEVGHAYGPQSQEFMDITLRTDQQLAGFLSSLDARIGLQHCLIVLTSDHGAVAMPEFSLQKGLAAGRFDPIELGQRFEARLSAVLGTPPDGRTYVQLVQMPWMYVNEQLVVERGGDAQALRRALDDFAAAEPGLASIFLAADIVKPDFVRDDLTRRVRRSYFAGRSGQVYLHTKRYWHYDLREAGHGSAHDYDTHVPLLMLGPGIRAGWYTAEATPADVVPTLAHLLGVEPPEGADGRVLTEALQSP